MGIPATSLSRNVLFNVGGYVVSVATTFFITPITIHALGDGRYGAWALVSELIGYYGLLDLGIRGAVSYFVARYSARNQDEDLKETIASAFWILSGCGTLAFSISVGFILAFPYLFQTEGLNLAEVQHSLLIMSALIGLSLPMNAFTACLVGKQRFDITTGAEITTRLLSVIATYVALKTGYGLVALALIQTATRVIYWALTLAACNSVLGGVFARPTWFKIERVRNLLGYGGRNAVGQVALLVIYRVDLTVVAMFVGIAQVTYYAIGATLVSYASALCSSITQTFTPRFTDLHAREFDDELQRLYLSAMRLSGMLTTVLAAGMLVFGKDFIQLWLGAPYVSGSWTERSDIIMVILVLANLPRMLQSISWQLLYATARVRFLMWLNLCEAIANLSLSLLLVRYYGPVGVALGTLFPLFVSHLLIMPLYTSDTFQIPLLHLFRKGLSVPLMTGLLTAGIGLLLTCIAPPSSWMIFFIDTSVTAVLGCLLCLTLGFSREEHRAQLARLRAWIGAQAPANVAS